MDDAHSALACTHNPASLNPPIQSDDEQGEEDDAAVPLLQPDVVSLHELVSVPELVYSDDNNTCNANVSSDVSRPIMCTDQIECVKPRAPHDEKLPPLQSTASPCMVCMGCIEHVHITTDTHLIMVIDSGATSHMSPHRGAFVTYTPLPLGHYVELANKSKVPVLGVGKTLQ
jgi:hypothetical protein